MKKFGLIILSVFVASVMVMTSHSVQAASNSLGVNPRRDYVVKPGEKISDTLIVTNLSKTDELRINIEPVDFGPKDETGSPALLLKRIEPTTWSLKPYLTITKSMTIPAGKSAEVPFTVAIPQNVGAGSYYSAIKYSADGVGSSDSVSLASSSATLMFVRVPGEANDSLTLQKFGAFTPDTQGASGVFGTFFSATPPKYISYRLKNAGNVAEQPTGSVNLKNMFGKQVKLFENANPNANIVLIDQTRRIDLCLNEERLNRKDPDTGRNVEETNCLDASLSPGRYTSTLALVYGDNGSSSREIRATATFWYLPAWFLVLVFVVIISVALVSRIAVQRVIKARNSTHKNKR